MIVKAISHKSNKRSVMKKLIDYVFAPEKMIDHISKRQAVVAKRHIRGYETNRWVDAFKRNDDNRTFTHKNRVVLRHEVVSFSPEDNHRITPEILQNIGKWYLKNRSQSLGVCAAHYEESIHLHFIISAVGINGKSTRITRQEFKAFKIRLQEFQKEKYPELSHSIVNHSKKKALKLELTQKELHMRKSRGVLSEKEKTSLLVKRIAKRCKSLEELAKKIREEQLQPYYRSGMLKGLWLGNRKLRLTTLGVDKSHLKVLTIEQKRLNELQSNKDNTKEIDY